MDLRLVVMRHARSPGASAPNSDHERPLDPRGWQEAREIGGMLATRDWWPDLVLASDARRARETWESMEGGHPGTAARFSRKLYGAVGRPAAEVALEELEGITAAGRVLLLGHNPEWERLVATLAGQAVGLGTANAALLAGEGGSWAEVARAGRMRLVDVLRPRDDV